MHIHYLYVLVSLRSFKPICERVVKYRFVILFCTVVISRDVFVNRKRKDLPATSKSLRVLYELKLLQVKTLSHKYCRLFTTVK